MRATRSLSFLKLGGEVKQGIESKLDHSPASALSPKSPPPTALATALGIVTTGITIAQKEYKQRVAKEQLENVKKILELYKSCLVNITVSGVVDRPTLPPPFCLDEEDNSKSATALMLNPAIRRDLLQDHSVISDSFLLEYAQHIYNAKQHILRFYDARLKKKGFFTQVSESDVTASVLTYLLIMLSEHCTHFQGYDTEIAILSGIIGFIKGFVSIPGVTVLGRTYNPKKRLRFEILKMACKDLRNAKRVLRDHSNSRTLKSYVDELMSACSKSLVPELSIMFTKLITPDESWELVESASLKWIADGIVQPELKRSHSRFGMKSPPVLLTDSIFKNWLQSITAFRLDPKNAIKMTIELKDAQLPEVKAFFKSCPNFVTLKSPQAKADGVIRGDHFIPVGYDEECHLIVASEMPAIFVPHSFLMVRRLNRTQIYEVNEKRQPIEFQIANVPQLSEVLASFASKPTEKWGSKELKVVNAILTGYRNTLQLKARAFIFLHLALLLDQLTDLDQFCQRLSDCIRELGEIYINNPHHCSFVFESLTALGKDINDRIGSLLNVMEKIEDDQDSANDLLLKHQADLALNLQNKLSSIQKKVMTNISGIASKHEIHNSRIGNPGAKGVIDCDAYEKSQKKEEIRRMLMYTTAMTMKYGIGTENYKLGSVVQAIKTCTPVSSLRNIVLRGSYTPSSNLRTLNDGFAPSADGGYTNEIKLFHAQLTYPRPLLPKPPLIEFTAAQETQADSDTPPSPASEDAAPQVGPGLLLIKIQLRLQKIYNEEKPDSKTREAYEHLYQALDGMNIRIQKLEKEKDSPERLVKMTAMKKLTAILCDKTLQFLTLEKKKRVAQAEHFSTVVIKDELWRSENRFLDEHKSLFTKFLRVIKELALCLVGYGFYLAYKRGGFFKTGSRAAAYQVEKSSVELKKCLI